MLRPLHLRQLARRLREKLDDPAAALAWLRSQMGPLAQSGRAAATPGFNRFDSTASYEAHVANLKARSSDTKAALEQAIGGEFDAFGRMERDLLISLGLGSDSYVIDVGCGAGRLARPLSAYLLDGRYFGLDVVPELVAHAAAIAARPGWRFETAAGLSIDEEAARADFVCFFSVFTHLLHEESYTYLAEAKRVLKPGGAIVFSFLEFEIYSHWAVFEENLRNIGSRHHLNQFMSRDGIHAWAHHLGLRVEALFDGDKPHIPLTEPLVLDNGTRVEKLGNLGQSVCVMRS